MGSCNAPRGVVPVGCCGEHVPNIRSCTPCPQHFRITIVNVEETTADGGSLNGGPWAFGDVGSRMVGWPLYQVPTPWWRKFCCTDDGATIKDCFWIGMACAEIPHGNGDVGIRFYLFIGPTAGGAGCYIVMRSPETRLSDCEDVTSMTFTQCIWDEEEQDYVPSGLGTALVETTANAWEWPEWYCMPPYGGGIDPLGNDIDGWINLCPGCSPSTRTIHVEWTIPWFPEITFDQDVVLCLGSCLYDPSGVYHGSAWYGHIYNETTGTIFLFELLYVWDYGGRSGGTRFLLTWTMDPNSPLDFDTGIGTAIWPATCADAWGCASMSGAPSFHEAHGPSPTEWILDPEDVPVITLLPVDEEDEVEDCGCPDPSVCSTSYELPEPPEVPTECVVCGEGTTPQRWDISISGSTTLTVDGESINGGPWQVCLNRTVTEGEAVLCYWERYVSCKSNPGQCFKIEMREEAMPLVSAYTFRLYDNWHRQIAEFDSAAVVGGEGADCETEQEFAEQGAGGGTATATPIQDECDPNPDDYIHWADVNLYDPSQTTYYLGRHFQWGGATGYSASVICAGCQPDTLTVVLADFGDNEGAGSGAIPPSGTVLNGQYELVKIVDLVDADIVGEFTPKCLCRLVPFGMPKDQGNCYVYHETGEPWAILAWYVGGNAEDLSIRVALLWRYSYRWFPVWRCSQLLETGSCMNIDETFTGTDEIIEADWVASWPDGTKYTITSSTTVAVTSPASCYCAD